MSSAPQLFPNAPELRPVMGNRDLFSGLAPLVYMNHAGISPPSILVKKAVNTALLDYAKLGAGAFPHWIDQRQRLKQSLARLIGAEENELALMSNTTFGVIAVAQSLDWKVGDGVIVFDGEFPANVTPWQMAAQKYSLALTMLDGRLYLQDQEAALQQLREVLERGGVRLVAVSAVQFQTGFRMPLAEMASLCHQHGALLFVDAVQACGVVPLDVRSAQIDFLASGSHKWLMGTEGAGFLFASRSAFSHLGRSLSGWLSHEEPVDFLFEGAGHLRYDKPVRNELSFLEVGNVSTISFAALEAGLSALQHFGIEAIFAHVQLVHDAIEGRAIELGYRSLRAALPASRSGSLCLLPPVGKDVRLIHRGIVAQGVACAVPDGVLRFSPHWPNAVDEAEQVVLTLEHLLSL